MSTEFLPYVSRLDASRYQPIVLIHEMPDAGRPRLVRETVGDPCPSCSVALRRAIQHANTLQSGWSSDSMRIPVPDAPRDHAGR